jgi:hypothetical protein
VESCCEFGIEPLGSMKCWETIEWPNILLSLISFVNSETVLLQTLKNIKCYPTSVSVIYKEMSSTHILMVKHFQVILRYFHFGVLRPVARILSRLLEDPSLATTM